MIQGIRTSAGRIAAIARNTVLEAARNRAFLGLGIAAVALVVSSIALSGLAVSDQKTRVLTDFGLFMVGLLDAAIAIVMGVILVYKEIDRKTFYLVLSKPVRRSEVLAGKFLGLAMVLALSVAVMGGAWAGSLAAGGGTASGEMVKALVLVWLEGTVITAVAVFFSSFATPVMSGVFTAGMFILGRVLYVLAELLAAKKTVFIENPALVAIARAGLYVLPDLSVFNMSRELVVGVPVGWDYVGGAAVYALGYCALFLALGMVIFERKDFV